MTGLSRRNFLASAAVASAAFAGGRVDAAPPPLLLYDRGLAAGRRFAAHTLSLGGQAVALRGDRVRQARDLIAASPAAIFAITQRSDELLVGEVAAELGYRRAALVRHGADGRMTVACAARGAAVGALAQLSYTAWPEAFAELALDKVGQCPIASDRLPTTGLSWVLVRT
jgi:hypothetical protein